ncbi:MAG: isoprenylcysteine carboxylmethyltransferase family protein [bacterium]|nr:isoprenylcysteine carboxylmethyltransferase family protein [bacterium]MDI1337210.1 isoprenylcysteine carboxylmethyltransferase family protein [Lacunisphaera sp.]
MWLFLKNLLFTVLVPGFVAGWVPWVFLLRRAGLPAAWTLRHYAALPLFVTGAAFYLACLWLFGTNGRGTPAPIDPPKRLVMRGPYRWVRNPMYLAVLLFVLGEVVFFWHLTLALYLVFLASAFQVFVVAVEEDALRRRFGAIYSDYCNVTNRWLPRTPKPRLETVAPFDARLR